MPQRSEAYIGVLIDDLVTRGVREPYRMFTSRAEHRLLLREDNADLRLTPLGRELGLVGDERWRFFERKRAACEAEFARLASRRVSRREMPQDWVGRVLGGASARDASALELLRRPEVGYRELAELIGGAEEPDDDRLAVQVRLQVEVRAKYSGYIERQQDEIDRQRRSEALRLPEDLDYSQVAGFSHEVRQCLAAARPATLGQAARIPGVTPAAISILLVHLKKHGRAA